jgi:hypothetical protein
MGLQNNAIYSLFLDTERRWVGQVPKGKPLSLRLLGSHAMGAIGMGDLEKQGAIGPRAAIYKSDPPTV